MNADLEKLKTIVYGEGWDDESRKAISDLEERFDRAVKDANLLNIPTVTEYVQHLEDEITQIKEKLSENTLELSERNLIQLSERKRQARIFLEHFKPKSTIEETIKQHLNVAQGKKDI